MRQPVCMPAVHFCHSCPASPCQTMQLQPALGHSPDPDRTVYAGILSALNSRAGSRNTAHMHSRMRWPCPPATLLHPASWAAPRPQLVPARLHHSHHKADDKLAHGQREV